MSALDVWYMTTGEAGYRTQARGLARALSARAREWIIDLAAPWAWLPGRLAAPVALLALDASGPARPERPIVSARIACARLCNERARLDRNNRGLHRPLDGLAE